MTCKPNHPTDASLKSRRRTTNNMPLHTLLRAFNSRSRDSADHLKIIANELRLCSNHPRFITCTITDLTIDVRCYGPERLRCLFACEEGGLQSLLLFLQERRDVGDELLDWELDDWVGAGNPCRLRGSTPDRPKPLGFGADDLWCVALFPDIEARID